MATNEADRMLRKGDGTYTVTLVFDGLTLPDAAYIVAHKDAALPAHHTNGEVSEVQFR